MTSLIRYTHVPPNASRFLRSTCSPEGARALCKLIGLFGFFAVYWSLYDQSGSAWVLQVSVSDGP
jgi:POT family proton-dependent oligopeptide transporter